MQSTLPKLAVFAKFVICLLMVVMPEAAPAPVESSVQLYNQCSKGLVKVNPTGMVYTDRTDDDKFVNMKMRSYNHSGIVTIYNEDSKKYLCFNKRGKLVGRPHIDSGFSCYFREGIEHNYFQFYSAEAQTRSIGFSPQGKPLRKPLKRKKQRLRANGCYNFLKVSDNRNNVEAHNRLISQNPPKVSDDFAKQSLKNKSRQSKLTPAPAIRHNHKRHRNRTNKM